MKLSLVVALAIGCSSPSKPAAHEPVPPPATAPTTATDTPPSHDLPATPTQPEAEPTPASPVGTQAQIAAQDNLAGTRLLAEHKYSDASAKFRDAAVRVPEPGYFFNLCTSLYQEGKFSDALSACNATKANHPRPELAAKTDALATKIKDDAQHQEIKLK